MIGSTDSVSYDVPLFTVSDVSCTPTYAVSVAGANVGTDTSFFTASAVTNPRGYSWDSALVANAGTYTVSVTGDIGCGTTHSVTYTVTLLDCNGGLTVVPPASPLATQVYRINNSATQTTINWDAFTVTPPECTDFTYEAVITPNPSEASSITVNTGVRSIVLSSDKPDTGWIGTSTPADHKVDINVVAADTTTKYVLSN